MAKQQSLQLEVAGKIHSQANNTQAKDNNDDDDDDDDDKDTTSFHPNQAHWSIENLPSVLYALRPGTQYVKSRARVRKTTYKVFGKHIRDFLVLPSRISSRVEGWRLEAWFRLDRRVETQDILDRINPKFRSEVTSLDLEMRCEEFRRMFNVADWKSQSSINEIWRLAHSLGVNMALNTTRGVTPGLIDPEKGEEGGRIPIPQKWGKVDSVEASWPFFVIQGLRKPAMTSSACFWPSGRDRFPLLQADGQGLGLGQPGNVSSFPVRKRWVEDCIQPMSPQKRQKPTRRTSATYPKTPFELASHHNTPVFREPSYDSSTMTLEEYLNRNLMSYEDYLYQDEHIGKGGRTRSNSPIPTTPRKGNVIDPSLMVL